ncbi:MAG: acetate kinase [Deltaproteobacteria bacterium]|nr:acetate kinase [Deltaproteobacteria bacterium]
MKILVINTGSSSVKYKLYDLRKKEVLSKGLLEKIYEPGTRLTHEKLPEHPDRKVKTENSISLTHKSGLERIAGLLSDNEYGVISNNDEISAVGHRVVHGGETFKTPAVIDEKVISAIKENIPLAPLHNPSNLTGIEIVGNLFPKAIQVAVFDTTFHQTMPPEAFIYALPYELYEKHRVRKYGFHGTSHAYVSRKAAGFLERPLDELNMITIHLGNGGSMCAIQNGSCIETSMGMTPLGGLVMGTRCGDLDPSIPFFLSDHLNMSLKEIDSLLNKSSGLKGICGVNDMREVIKRKNQGDIRAELALKKYIRRIRKYIGAYFAILEKLDCLIFTGGIGENAMEIREGCCSGLNRLGIEIDRERNQITKNKIREINKPMSQLKILVVPTDEELMIALETQEVLSYL